MFLEISRRVFNEMWPRMRQSVESLTDDQVWWRPNEASNSVGNLLLHLNGNIRQWLLTSFAESADTRNRPSEFAERTHIPAAVLLARLEEALEQAASVLSRLTEADLLRSLNIQGFDVTGMYAVYHVVEHFAMHYGQILYIAKQLRGEDLGFFRHLDKTGRAR